jgi:hypothetical protein
MLCMEREPVFIAEGYRGRVAVCDHGVDVYRFGVFGTDIRWSKRGLRGFGVGCSEAEHGSGLP